MKGPTRLYALTLAAAFACFALAAAGAQRSPGGAEASGEGGRLYPVHVNGKWGYVDRTGKIVIEPRYDNEAFFSDGVTVVMSGFDTEAAARAKPRGNTVRVPVGPDGLKWEVIDTSGKTLAVFAAGGVHPLTGFDEGLALIAESAEGKGSRYGYIDKAGRVNIRPQFEKAGAFCEGLADACVESGRCGYGYIDRSGGFVIDQRFDDAQPFRDGRALVGADGELAYIDREGNVLWRRVFR